MAFLGTQQKCKVCEKTVYLMDQLMADGVTYHKSCFKCNHCKGTLKRKRTLDLLHIVVIASNIMSSVITHQWKVFYTANLILNNSLGRQETLTRISNHTRSPSKAAGMFSGTQEKCAICSKTAYPLEKVTVEGLAYHKSCFRCSHGGCAISPSNYAALEGILYCKHHFSQLFKEKGSYNHLIKCASVKRTSTSVPDS
ncbi:hypothetical protein IEQ34_013533 [Dendrobium chrysotoxum]|uniref:LIM zinc-binding domain-containing protein n=1 Tax=Dendrobium chrysotoxum TaxID=161865 RepID=A0AAV7GR96_DENCH|nr:hypothetical protein IEQ34_013533 [Dendrobium chrysotoxum]